MSSDTQKPRLESKKLEEETLSLKYVQVVWVDQHVLRWRFVKIRTLVDQANEDQK